MPPEPKRTWEDLLLDTVSDLEETLEQGIKNEMERLPQALRNKIDPKSIISSLKVSVLTNPLSLFKGLDKFDLANIGRVLFYRAKMKLWQRARYHYDAKKRDIRREASIQQISAEPDGEVWSPPATGLTPDKMLILKEDSERASAIFYAWKNGLPEHLQQTVTLAELGYTAEEIAPMIRVTPRTIRNYLAKLKEDLARALELL